MLKDVKKQILFVDDEPSILAGIRRLLRNHRDEWEMTFANSGKEALQVMQDTHIDVVVTDMRMPEMDGAELLSNVRELHPDAVRIILSGQTDLEGKIKRLPLAHQFLHKPCEPEQLRQTVQRSCALQSRLKSEELRRAIGGIESLPSPPKVLQELSEVLSLKTIEVDLLVQVIERDVALSAKLLQLVNSATIGENQQISSVPEAARTLGVEMIRNMMAAATGIEEIASHSDLPSEAIEELDAHSHAVGKLAASLVNGKDTAQHAFVGGLLHDIGHLIVSTHLQDKFAQIMERVRGGNPTFESEREILGATHAEIGAYLLELWGIPYFIIEMVACHHDEIDPDKAPPLEVFTALQIAERHVAKTRERDAFFYEEVPELDSELLTKLGCTQLIES